MTALYNAERYLPSFLENVDEIKSPELMVLHLNFSAPTSSELKLAEKFKKTSKVEVRIQINKKRISIAAATNQIIKASRSDYLALWNVDDTRTPNSLYSQLMNLERSTHDICIGPYYVHKKTQNGVDYKKLVDVSVSSEAEFLRGMLLGPFFMLRRNLVQKAGYWDEQFLSGGDFDWAVRLCHAGKVIRTDEILGTYLNIGAGASTTLDSLQPLEREVINLRYGIFDKVDPTFLARALQYNLRQIKVFDKSLPIEDYFANYDSFLQQKSLLVVKSEPVSPRTSIFKRFKLLSMWKWIQFRKFWNRIKSPTDSIPR